MKEEEVKTRIKIHLETQKDLCHFVALASTFDDTIRLEVVTDDGMRVNARSVLGMAYAMTYSDLWLESDADRGLTQFMWEFGSSGSEK